MVSKAGLAQRRFAFAVGALRQLLADKNFTTLLRAEGIDSFPKFLADRVGIVGCEE
jgi:ParB family chromosome partitioning protein